MEANSKFLNVLKKNSSFLKEDNFVKGNEKSELPDMNDIPDDNVVQTNQKPDIEKPDNNENKPISNFTDKEKDILNVALQIYRSNPENSIDTKNQFSNMFEEEQYEELLGRLISIADELSE